MVINLKNKKDMKVNYNKHIWEGWTVGNFIEELEVIFKYKTFNDKAEVKKWCISEQPYYKKNIPEVTDYFVGKYNETIKN